MTINRIQKQISIFEPDEGLRSALELILGDYYTLTFLSNETDFLDSIVDRRLDLLILDVDFIRKSLERIKAIKEKYPDLTILLLSVNFELAYQENAIRIGAGIRFQDKPFESEEFLERIQTLIRGYSSKRFEHTLRIKNTDPTKN